MIFGISESLNSYSQSSYTLRVLWFMKVKYSAKLKLLIVTQIIGFLTKQNSVIQSVYLTKKKLCKEESQSTVSLKTLKSVILFFSFFHKNILTHEKIFNRSSLLKNKLLGSLCVLSE